MRIMVCIDGSTQSDKALEKGLVIAGGCGADQVIIITVHENKYLFPDAGTESLALTHEDLRYFEKIGEQEKEAKEIMLKNAAKRFEEKGLPVETVLACGHPAEAIARTALERDVELIIIGNRGLGGLKKFLLGSVSNAVLQEAKCSVLVVK